MPATIETVTRISFCAWSRTWYDARRKQDKLETNSSLQQWYIKQESTGQREKQRSRWPSCSGASRDCLEQVNIISITFLKSLSGDAKCYNSVGLQHHGMGGELVC
jgi:2-polyprenyl-3-methyl-5-hydroxy-6-metoxy-1,4-benzoquinol methylase